MLEKFTNYLRKEEGQALAEYGLILALIAVIAIAGLQILGVNILAVLNDIAGKVVPS